MAMLMLVLRMVLGSVFLGNSGAVVDVASAKQFKVCFHFASVNFSRWSSASPLASPPSHRWSSCWRPARWPGSSRSAAPGRQIYGSYPGRHHGRARSIILLKYILLRHQGRHLWGGWEVERAVGDGGQQGWRDVPDLAIFRKAPQRRMIKKSVTSWRWRRAVCGPTRSAKCKMNGF